MNVGILGSGDVGRALGKGFLSLGHTVKLATRDASQEKITTWVNEGGEKASTGTPQETALFGEIIVLASPWSGTESILTMAGSENIAGKVVIDVTNPLDFSTGKPVLALGHTTSGGEKVQQWLPQSTVVKAFNTVGNAHMFKPDFPGGPPTMFIAGNDAKAKELVTGILKDFGWDTADLGGIENSRYLEAMCMAWVNYAFIHNSWNHAFKLLTK